MAQFMLYSTKTGLHNYTQNVLEGDCMKRFLVMATLIFLLTATASAQLSYHGFLRTETGVDGTGPWDTDFKISWWVEQQMDNSWHYTYNITDTLGNALRKAVSHFQIEVSPNVMENDFWGFGGSWFFTDETQSGIPFVNSLRLDYGAEGQTEWSFYSTRAPVWGDFFAKDGTYGSPDGAMLYAWNTGFYDADPLVGPSDGSIGNKILRPDTSNGVVPEPGTLGLIGLGLMGLVAGRRRLK
jgi:hypothetical protein